MFKKIALFAPLAAASVMAVAPTQAHAYELCKQVNQACDVDGNGKRGYCKRDKRSSTGWSCYETPDPANPIPDAYTIGGVSETGGSTDIFEVVECVEDRDIWVETNPGGTSDDICEVLYEFFVDKNGEVVFVNTEASPMQEYVEKSR
ncbi:MAG: hypothetical protein CL927_05345 [Deltaproteobacteria bacterium]|nr:hypothetical protein [Deltaproteobacteria bacterium]HCH62911.1 hypothetical protein [Deltaproteobacteria bacterium]